VPKPVARGWNVCATFNNTLYGVKIGYRTTFSLDISNAKQTKENRSYLRDHSWLSLQLTVEHDNVNTATKRRRDKTVF
jgi:hypothetical protein